MRWRLIAVGCAAVLLWALGLSAWLADDAAIVQTVSTAKPAAVGAEPVPTVAPAEMGQGPVGPVDVQTEPTTPATEPRQAPPAENPAPVDSPVPVGPPALEAPSPYLGDSKELDYAEALLREPIVNRDRLQSARDVFARCVEAHPELDRCRQGLAGAESLLFTTVRASPNKGRIDLPKGHFRVTPTLQVDETKPRNSIRPR